MTTQLPALTQFAIEAQPNGLVHLVFDCPGKSMNVFSNKAIHELGAFAEWLHRADDVRGVVVRSGKTTGFCAGADLTELGVAYDMIVAAPVADRFDIAFNHFFPLSHAIRRLESAGKPVAAAIAGVALGGGCELALGAHYRIATDSRRTMMGLPECAVGLLPGAGGTQRITRLVGVELGLEVLLLGRNLAGDEAVKAGLVNAIVPEGEEIAAAEAWILSDKAHATQPWDRPHAAPLAHADYQATIARHRALELARMLGHEPAPLAILDCVELGLMQPIDGAIRSEMSVFARLIQRPEPRNMIRAMFLGKQAYDKAARDNAIPESVTRAVSAVAGLVKRHVETTPVLAQVGFKSTTMPTNPVQTRVKDGLWLHAHADAQQAVSALADCVAPLGAGLSTSEMLQADYALARDGTIPAYLGALSGITDLAHNHSTAS